MPEPISSVQSGSRGEFFKPVHVVEIGKRGHPTDMIVHDGRVIVYNATGQTTIDGGMVTADGITASVIIAGHIHSLNLANMQAGSNPATGVIMDSAGLRGYKSSVLQFSLATATGDAYLKGQISAGSGDIGGWTISATTLANSTNIILDADNKRISIKSATFGTDGVQLEYNAGNPRAYIGNGSNRYFNFDGTNISFEGTNASLTTAGLFTASNASITGAITASSGSIAGWDIGASTISKNNATLSSSGWIELGTGNDIVHLNAVNATWRLFVGHATPTSAPFRVDKSGNTTTTSITATGGTIGGWTLSSTALSGNNITISASSKYIRLESGTGGQEVGLSSDLSANDTMIYAGIGIGSKGSAPFRVTKTGHVTASSGTIGGWDLGTDRFESTDDKMIMDSNTKSMKINSYSFGTDGIQLEYNAGNPRAYIGNGSNRYFNFDGTNITWQAANAQLDSSGNMIIGGNFQIGGLGVNKTILCDRINIGASSAKSIYTNASMEAAGDIAASTMHTDSLRLNTYSSGAPSAGKGRMWYFDNGGTIEMRCYIISDSDVWKFDLTNI